MAARPSSTDMTRPPIRRGTARGFGLLELMISSAILLVSVLGFLGAMREAVNATAVAHRRTESTLLRTGLVERLTVSRRDSIAALAGLGWVVESCYDVNAVPMAAGENPGATSGAWVAAFACPATSVYRRLVSVTVVPNQRIWRVALYVERIDQACTAATRHSSIGCVGADLYLTD